MSLRRHRLNSTAWKWTLGPKFPYFGEGIIKSLLEQPRSHTIGREKNINNFYNRNGDILVPHIHWNNPLSEKKGPRPVLVITWSGFCRGCIALVLNPTGSSNPLYLLIITLLRMCLSWPPSYTFSLFGIITTEKLYSWCTESTTFLDAF